MVKSTDLIKRHLNFSLIWKKTLRFLFGMEFCLTNEV